ncbi:orotate phosphoribosyltransferase [Heyndrickxia ginsengihumi]|uniref:Orotate phosphoribosyltransferase n=1 Tax=Heyndrickxia ginsengihumi TaxID=363870 RepID=A0A0A6VFE7_9BACI|nr:orotate phosphoribosyltransferase [Heyndrickxia ginsengihumi]KHD86193.1 orotate phosphoribosyltransferase [Heyndrickxia ginsengihumi]MBE6183450.1 orotate phosphoribosyltransferase [Bacillus sp. (in: firmicutes)]MCM3022433.1 orotate phosphoribosyltransferase [Heyndrickxia ginsengihumi]NEY18626.1 orotate phosphoribosyltransferase [Heyndrickxia ginsengihumi]
MEKYIAGQLLDIEAVFLRPKEPFTWSSGLKSPIYCDNRITLSYPNLRKEIAIGLKKLIEQHFPEAELIAGTATAGIAHAAFVSDLMNLPMCYVRSSAKKHGKGNQIEGRISSGQQVVVVEDLISTGGSVLTVVNALKEAGCNVLGVVAIFNYQLEAARQNFEQKGVEAYTLSNYSALLEVGLEKQLILEEELETLHNWRKEPENWGI